MKKFLALILALAMALSLAACGGAPADDGDAAATDEPIKIGFVNYDPTAEQYLVLDSYFEYLKETYNFEIMASEALNSAEGELAFIDACAAAGCKAVFGYYNVSNEQALLKCAEYGMYYFGQGANKAIVDNPELMNNEYYLGSFYVGPADYNYGYACIEALVEAGCKKIAGVSGGKNFGVQMFIDRWQGAMDAIADYQAQGVDAGWWKVSNVEEAGYYGSVQGGENGWVFSAEDLSNLLVANNPDVTVDDYRALYTAVTAAEIQARHAD